MKNKTNQKGVAFLAVLIIMISIVFDAGAYAFEIKEENQNLNEVSGDVSGIEGISGFAPAARSPQDSQRLRTKMMEVDKQLISSCIRQGCSERSMRQMLAHLNVENQPRDFNALDYPLIPKKDEYGNTVKDSDGRTIMVKDTSKQPTSFGILQQTPSFIMEYNTKGANAVNVIKKCNDNQQECVDQSVLAFKNFEEKKFEEWQSLSAFERSRYGSFTAYTAIKYNGGDLAGPNSATSHKTKVVQSYEKYDELDYYGTLYIGIKRSDTQIAKTDVQHGETPRGSSTLLGYVLNFLNRPVEALPQTTTSSDDIFVQPLKDPPTLTSKNGFFILGREPLTEGEILYDVFGFEYKVKAERIPIRRFVTDSNGKEVSNAVGQQFTRGKPPIFVLPDGINLIPQLGDIVWRQEREDNKYWAYRAEIDDKGYYYYIRSDGKKTVQFRSANEPVDLSDRSHGFTVLEVLEGYFVSQTALKDKLDIPPQFRAETEQPAKFEQRIGSTTNPQGTQKVPGVTEVKFKNVDMFVGYALQGETYYVDDEGQVFLIGKDGKRSDKVEGFFTTENDINNYKNRYIGIKSKGGTKSYEISIVPRNDAQLIDAPDRQFEIRDSKIYTKGAIGSFFDSEIKNENGNLVIDFGAGTKSPLTQQQIGALQRDAPIATSKLLMNPYFVQSDGSVYTAKVGDKFTRQEDEQFITYTYTGTKNGKAIFEGEDGKTATFNDPDKLDLTHPDNAFNAVAKKDGSSSISSVAYDDRIAVPDNFKHLQRITSSPTPATKLASSASYEVKPTSSKTAYTVDYIYEKDKSATVADVIGKTFGTSIDETSAKIISDSYEFELNGKPIALAKEPSTGKYQFYYVDDLDNGNPKPNSQRVLMKEDNQIIIIEKQVTYQPDRTGIDYDFGPLPPGVVTTLPEKINGKQYKVYSVGDKLIWIVDGQLATQEDMDAFNKYYSAFGPPKVSGFTTDAKIGKETFKITYDSTNNPTKICNKDNDCAQIDVDILKSIKNNIKDAELTWDDNGYFSFTITASTKTGKDKDLLETTQKTNYFYTKAGQFVTVTNEVKNKDGKTISLSEVEYVSEFDTETGKYKEQRYGKTNYKAGEDGFIDKDGSDYKTIIYDAVTGRPVGIEVKENGVIKGAGIDLFFGPQEEEDLALKSELSRLNAQYTATYFIASIEKALTEFQGLGYLASLFMDQDALLAWRDRVDRIFATFYLGTEYITSSICSEYLDGEEEGIAYAETPQGLAQIAAHVEATKTEPIVENGTTQFIYKITFSVRNGDYAKDLRAPEEMKVNVVLKGQKTVNVFKKEQVIKRGSTLSRAGRNAIVQESPTSFDKICLTFDQVPIRWKISDKEICNRIQASSGQPTFISTPASGKGSGGQTSDEINDF